MADEEIVVMGVPEGEKASDLVEVVAPMDLPEGYRLDVEVDGQTRTVKVPAGGVLKGQTFHARPFGGQAHPAKGSAVVATVPHHIPMNHWRDGLCDCCKHGCCHAMCWFGYCFEPILVGQVMTRMGRNAFGGPGKPSSMNDTCKIITIIFILMAVIQIALNTVLSVQNCYGGSLQYNFDTYEYEVLCPDGSVEEVSDAYIYIRSFIGAYSFVFGIYLFIVTCRTRRAIRNKYNIDAKCCGEVCEDCCCIFWCSCCAVQQMARHTNDYSTYDVKCCSSDCCNKRGQQPQVPEIEV